MKQNKTELIVVLDRSGSMETIRTDMEGALKALVEKQAGEKGECLFSLYQFDNQYEPVLEQVHIGNVSKSSLVLEPRGGTALVDAIGRTINSVGDRLKNTNESDRPETVIMTIITDGEENASHEYTSEKVKEMVKHQTDKYQWKFLFLGSNIDAVKTGSRYGFNVNNSMSYNSSAKGVANTSATLNNAVSYMRSCNLDYQFTDEERDKAMEK